MSHTMKTVMQAIEAARTEGGQRLPVLTSNQCHALAVQLDLHDVLPRPAKVGGTRFGAGCSTRLVVEAAIRRYEYDVTPEKEAARIKRVGLLQQLVRPGGEIETLRAQLASAESLVSRLNNEAERLAGRLTEAHALLRKALEYIRADGGFTLLDDEIEDALSASAEPSTRAEIDGQEPKVPSRPMARPPLRLDCRPVRDNPDVFVESLDWRDTTPDQHCLILTSNKGQKFEFTGSPLSCEQGFYLLALRAWPLDWQVSTRVLGDWQARAAQERKPC